MIIDVDSHHYETGSYKEIFDYIDDPVMRDNFNYSKGQTLHPRSTGGYQEMAGRITRYQHRATEQAPGAPHRDIGLTRKWMDSIGVDVACIFPTPMLGLGLNPVVQVEVQYARAYNRWLTEQHPGGRAAHGVHALSADERSGRGAEDGRGLRRPQRRDRLPGHDGALQAALRQLPT